MSADGFRWRNDLGSDVDSHARSFVNVMVYVPRRTARALRRYVAEMSAFLDLDVSHVEGRGWRRRNVRIRITGPVFATRVAYARIRVVLGADPE